MRGFRGDLERRRVTAPELSWALRGLVPVGAEIDQELARRLGLRPLDHTAMSHIMTSQAPSGPAQLSKRLDISIGSATELVDRLERAAHLIRRPQPQDPRSVVLQPGAVTGVLRSPRPWRQRFAVCKVHRGGAVGDRALSALDGTPLPQLGALG